MHRVYLRIESSEIEIELDGAAFGDAKESYILETPGRGNYPSTNHLRLDIDLHLGAAGALYFQT